MVVQWIVANLLRQLIFMHLINYSSQGWIQEGDIFPRHYHWVYAQGYVTGALEVYKIEIL